MPFGSCCAACCFPAAMRVWRTRRSCRPGSWGASTPSCAATAGGSSAGMRCAAPGLLTSPLLSDSRAMQRPAAALCPVERAWHAITNRLSQAAPCQHVLLGDVLWKGMHSEAPTRPALPCICPALVQMLEGGLCDGATVMSWRGMGGGVAAARAGYDVIMTPAHSCYLDYRQAACAGEPGAWYAMLTLQQASKHTRPGPSEGSSRAGAAFLHFGCIPGLRADVKVEAEPTGNFFSRSPGRTSLACATFLCRPTSLTPCRQSPPRLAAPTPPSSPARPPQSPWC
jgi:hypothetical protein